MKSLEISNRLSQAISVLKLKQAEVASLLDVTPSNLSQLLKGNRPIGKNMLKRIDSTLHINPEWLITGEGEMLKHQYIVDEIEELSVEEQSKIRKMFETGEATMVPLVHIDSVGGIHSGNSILSPEYVERYIPMSGARPGDVAIYQSGNSMAPAIPSGALLLIREVEGWQEYIGYGDVFVLLLRDDRRITKEIQRYTPDPQNYYWCVSYNPDVADEELPKSIIRRVWKVVKVLIDKGW